MLAGIVLAGMTACAVALPALADGGQVTVDLVNKVDGSEIMTLNTDHVKAGSVDFEVKNSSTNMVHEFLIVKTDMTFDQFPIDPQDPSKVDENKLAGVKELNTDLDPGKAGKLVIDLTPGRYVVFCNQPGHFAGGMRQVFTVE
jgi:uncharacterized cupredoxin-like copper-binding protein